MAGAVRISVPTELADDLVAEGVAVRPLLTRGGAVGEVITFLLNGVNTGASIVALSGAMVAGGRALPRLAEYFGGHQGGDTVEVVLRGPDGERIVRIEPNAPVEDAAEALRVALGAVRGEPASPAG